MPKITDAQLAKGYEQAKAVIQKRAALQVQQYCLCGMTKPGLWTNGVHHQEHRCARVITKPAD